MTDGDIAVAGEPAHGAFDAPVLTDRFGAVVESYAGDQLVLSWRRRSGTSVTEMLRYDPEAGLLRIFPLVRHHPGYENPFSTITELQVESPDWDPQDHTESGRDGLLHVVGLPRGFSAVYEYGLGLKRLYRGLVEEIETRSRCSSIRFTSSEVEGLEGDVFWITHQRFQAYRAVVDRNRGRAATAFGRVLEAEDHNAVLDLFGLERREPRYGTNPVIRAITEEVATGYVMDAEDRAILVDQVAIEAPKVAQESPTRFGRLREGIELVSLEVLIEQFEQGLSGHVAHRESHWQDFFTANPFALQQVFSAPILVVGEQVHVRATDALGRGSRIADFLCVNAVTRSAVVVEIKTPTTPLMAPNSYRGSGSAEVYPPAPDLSRAVSQAQAQMESVSRDFPATPSLGELDRWHVRGAVISGRVSELNDEQRASFLRYRGGLTALTVLGYDEVCTRLKSLRDMLLSPPAAPPDTGPTTAP